MLNSLNIKRDSSPESRLLYAPPSPKLNSCCLSDPPAGGEESLLFYG